MEKPTKVQKTCAEILNFSDFDDDFDDIGLLTAASHIWRTPAKQKVIKHISALSPSKRQPALSAKIFHLQKSVTLEEEGDEEEGDGEEGEEQLRPPASASPSNRPSQTPPPSSPSPVRESSLVIRSDPSRATGTLDGSEWDLEDDLIKEAGALTKHRPTGSRAAALSGRERWTLKDRSESEQAAWKIIFTALRLDYINEGPPPPDEERDSRLTDDSRLRAIIESRYREAFSEDSAALGGLEIEAVIFLNKNEGL